MSLQFNDTSTFRGLVQIYEKEIGANQGDISGDTAKLKQFTADVNLAFDDFLGLAFKNENTWQFDDSNQTDYPFIMTNLISSQRDYSFVTDGSGNLILDIYRVMIADSSGTYREIHSVDQEQGNRNDSNTDSFINGQNTSGTPTRYDKTANGIFLDPIPNYNYANGLKIFINREASYFVYTDTTKKPGVPGNLHRYFAIKPAHDYARRNNLANYSTLTLELQSLEKIIEESFARRERDVRRRLSANVENNK